MKKTLGALNCLYPMPTTLVGAMVDGKPNFITIAHVGIMDFAKVQPMLFVMNDKGYYRMGERLAGAWHIGKELKKK